MKAGKPMQKDFQPISFTKDEFLKVLDSAVKQIEDVVKRIESGETYAYFSTDQSMADSQKMKEVLSLPIEFDIERKDYPKVEIKM